MTDHHPAPRRPSPWPGSAYATRHRWQLDGVRSLADAASALRSIAAELTAGHDAGWELVEPMRNGHLVAARASRRKRPTAAPRVGGAREAPAMALRPRLVEEPPLPGDVVLDLRHAAASRTPAVGWDQGSLRHICGPPPRPGLLAELDRLVADVPGLRGPGLWGVAPARVGPGADLVRDGSGLRIHALVDGALVRTTEVVSFQHAADRAPTLLSSAAAYERLAAVVEAMAAAGGRLATVDDGMVHVSYGVA